jgi:hypothetical protein
MMKDFDFVGSYNNQRVTAIDAERTINMFEFIDESGKKPRSLLRTSGLVNLGFDFGTVGGFRAQFVFQNFEYNVVGNTLYRRSPSNVIVNLGTFVNTSSGYVAVTANSYQILFVDGINGYIWDTIANTFSQITDSSFPSKPIDATYLDGFFVVANGDTNHFQLSSFNQGMVWGPASNNYSADVATNSLTILASTLGGISGTANYQTGVPFVLSQPKISDSFVADATNDWITISSTTNYITGGAIKFSSTGTLPTTTPPINTTDTFFSIVVSATQLRIATTYANAMANVYVDITTAGTPPNNVINQPPAPLNTGDTYYAIYVDATHIKVANSLANAQQGTAITLTSKGGSNNIILSLGQLQQGSITSHPGNIVACRTLHRRLFLFSEYFTEVWENAGIGTNLPFRRNNGLLIEYGTPAVGSISLGFDMLFFLSQDRGGLGSIQQISGTQPVAVSNSALDYQLSQYNSAQKISDGRGFLLKENGVIFYRLNFTAANHTFVYNVSMSNPQSDKGKLWHEEEILDGSRHLAQTHSYFAGNNYVGHYAKPILYRVDNNVYTNDGEAIRRVRISKCVTPPGYQRIRLDRFHLDILQGSTSLYPINFANPMEPYVYLSLSKDGGQTYGYIIKAPIGRIGDRTFRTIWRKLGTTKRGQGFVLKIEYYDNTDFIILGAGIDMDVLPQ